MTRRSTTGYSMTVACLQMKSVEPRADAASAQAMISRELNQSSWFPSSSIVCRPPTASTKRRMPSQSTGCPPVFGGSSRRNAIDINVAPIPTGRLMKKIQRQLSAVTM